MDGTHDVTPCLRWRLKLKEAVEGYDAEARAHDKQMLDALTTAEMTERRRSMCSDGRLGDRGHRQLTRLLIRRLGAAPLHV